jgi:hypothetical protein
VVLELCGIKSGAWAHASFRFKKMCAQKKSGNINGHIHLQFARLSLCQYIE